MRKLKHMPLHAWPEADHAAFAAAYRPGDIFEDDAGPGAHLSQGWRKMIETNWRRWLGFLAEHHPEALLLPPRARITAEGVRAFIDHLEGDAASTTIAMAARELLTAARLIAPEVDWDWLTSLTRRLEARAVPESRFNRLVPPWQTLDFGFELMETAATLPSNGHRLREIQYRDGLILALLSLWPIRRRSIASLTISRHLQFDAAGLNILLHPEDTKAKRSESFRVPEALLPYVERYLKEIRPRLLGRSRHDGLWASCKGCPLTGGRIYDIARARIWHKFGKPMGLHDFRRAAATFIATDAPDMIGITPGVLQHASPEMGETYNLSQSVEASRRFAAHLAKTRSRLRSVAARREA